MKKIIISIIILAVLIAGFTFFPKKSDKAIIPTGKLSVVASFYPVYFFASFIGGDKAIVTNITPSGAEPHDYEPTPKQMADIEGASLLVLSGGVEAWGDRVLADRKSGYVLASNGLTTRSLVEDGKTSTDPHVWLSPTVAARMVVNIENAYIKADPTNEEYYRMRASVLASRLATLNTDYQNGLASCAKKDIVTSHAAFGYLAADYGLNQVSLTGLSPDEEPSSKKLVEVANYVKTNKVTTIFFESLLSPKLAQTIAAETGAKTEVLDPIEGISDADMKKNIDYFSVMKSNLNHIRTALVCP